MSLVGGLGMGINSLNATRYNNYKVFGVQIDSDGNGQLVFSDEVYFTTFALECGIENGISKNWEINIIKTFSGDTNNKPRKAIFDVSLNYVGLPADLYDEVIQLL